MDQQQQETRMGHGSAAAKSPTSTSNRQEQQCIAGAAGNLRDSSQRAYLCVEQLHLPSWQKMAREIANYLRPIFLIFAKKQ